MTTTDDTDATTEADDSREPGPGQLALDRGEPAAGDPDRGTIEVLPPARDVHVEMFGTLREHVGALQQAKFFAEGVVYTSLVPARFQGKPGDATAAILFGAEVGLSPIASLRSIIVIHGMPGFEARTMKALLKAKGYRFRTIEKSAERAEVECTSPDGTEVERAVWTIDDAIRAEYVPVKLDNGKWKTNDRGKLVGNMKYVTDPKTMLDAKATAEVCRSIAPHILLGMPYAAEELEDWDDGTADTGTDAPPPRPSRAGGVNKLRERAVAAQQRADDEVHDAEVVEDASPQVEAEPETEANTQVAAESPQVKAEPDEAQQPLPDPEPEPGADEADAAPNLFDRAKAMRSMHAMFREANLGGDDNRADRLSVIAEIIASPKSGLGQPWRPIKSSNDLTDAELGAVVAALTAAKPDKRGGLKWYTSEALNAASIREAGLE